MISSDIRYDLIEEVYHQGGTTRIAYGIAVYDMRDRDASVYTVAVRDITSDKQKLLSLVDQCNRCGLAPIHLCDVLEDHLF